MKTWVVRIVSVLVLVLAGAWLVSATEWAETEVPTPASEEVKKNSFYAVQSLLRLLGAEVVRRESLDELPPAQARLVLSSSYWDMFPEREQRLRRWVEQGGHLVMPGHLASRDMLESWIPLVREKPVRPDESDEPAAPKKKKSRSQRDEQRIKDADCRMLTEPDTVPASFAGGRSFRICTWAEPVQFSPADKRQPPPWMARGARGAEAIRVRVGQGTVTLLPSGVWHNQNLLRGDNALFAVAALQLRTAGSQVWFVAEEAREPFLRWLWQKSWVVWVVGLLALAAALWRAAVRFGPLAPSASTHRRSMAEQVRGTAGFLHMHGSDALHAAQLRALNESATRQLRGYAHRDAAARADAIAKATGLEAAMVVRAMADRARNPGAMALDLEVLETARRRLDANGPFVLSPSSASSSPSTP
ncbi:DUF4350 domain-containing protein [Variovorax sp.]|uniref:DUF4350 domain-containing protein n=1 Tax=Variovorax sp. TaxID=1871043 RepID=UPI003BAD3146